MVNPTKVIDDAFFAERTTVNAETGCVEWNRHISANGYGTLKYKRKAWIAHRFLWQYKNGEIPKGMIVCHKCDNRKCVNPEHLFLGTTQDNVDDKMRKNRFVKSCGENNGTSKLTNDDIVKIRTDIRPQHLIAKDFGVSQSLISAIKAGIIWKDVATDIPKDKKMTLVEFAKTMGLPYLNLKDRVYGGCMNFTEAVQRTAKQFNIDLQLSIKESK